MSLKLKQNYIKTDNSTSQIIIEKINNFKGNDLNDLCDAAELVVNSSVGFSIGIGRIEKSNYSQLENYFQGVILVPERKLIVGRFDKIIAGSIQIIQPNPNNQTSSFAASVDTHFVVPWARGFGIAKALLIEAEKVAKDSGYTSIRLSVRANNEAAIRLYEACGYQKWGILEKYEIMNGNYIAGNYYSKEI
jgi:ribosomal protein S18 acetylase RimI-like enzyme